MGEAAGHDHEEVQALHLGRERQRRSLRRWTGRELQTFGQRRFVRFEDPEVVQRPSARTTEAFVASRVGASDALVSSLYLNGGEEKRELRERRRAEPRPASETHAPIEAETLESLPPLRCSPSPCDRVRRLLSLPIVWSSSLLAVRLLGPAGT